MASPDTGTTINTYDSGGNLKTATDARGALATYSYDALNRVGQVVYSDQTINFGYDIGTNGIGHLTSASDANHSMSWTYDANGRVNGKGQTVGSITKSVGYAYTNGDLVSMVTPSGQTITYGYTNHRITSIAINGSALLSSVTYEPFGATSGWTWADAVTFKRNFNSDGNISSILLGSTISVGYDNALRITSLGDNYGSGYTWSLGYDLLDRVNSGTKTGTTNGWTYDANGNRLTQTGTAPSTFTPATTNNQLSSTSGTLVRTYAYDAAGNTTGYGTNSFGYNQRGRMSGANSTNYIYNALGQLIEKSATGGTTLLVYDESGHLLGEYTGTGALVQETVWMDDLPVATIRPNGSGVSWYYIQTDHMGAPRGISRTSDHRPVWRWDPDQFGTTAPNQNPYGFGTFVYNLRFPGQYYQSETGLNYNYFRDNDPQTGRYLESDPIGLFGGINTYNYARNTPVMRTDPQGLFAFNTSFTWHDVPKIDNVPWIPFFTSPLIGLTSPNLSSVRCTCTNCGGIWTLSNCSASLDVDVYIRNDLNATANAFSRSKEGEHVSDFMSGIGSIYRAGAAAEARERGLPYSSEALCESAAANAVNAAVKGAFESVVAKSKLRDTQGTHSWPASISPF